MKFFDVNSNTLVDAVFVNQPIVDTDRLGQQSIVGSKLMIQVASSQGLVSVASGYAVHEPRQAPGREWATPTKCVDYLDPAYIQGAEGPLVDAWYCGVTFFFEGMPVSECDVVLPVAGSGSILTSEVETKLHTILLHRYKEDQRIAFLLAQRGR